MADVTYRANLSANTIPTDPLLFGRSVIIKDRDNNYAPNLAAKTDSDKDIGIPQVLYIANALPTEYGYASVGYFGSKEKCPGRPYIAFPVRSVTDTALLIHTEEGHLYRLKKVGEAAVVPEFVYIGTYVGNLTYAHVSGVTYIFISGLGCYTYNFSTKVLDPVTLDGLSVAAILGITATGGYLLAWSQDAIAWSSLVDPTDFIPSLDTGAGGGSVEGARGPITVCVSNSYGVYIFTQSNCVSAQLSNNARYPFTFKEIMGSSGVDSVQEVSYEGNQNSAYAFTSVGYQQISHNGAKTIWTQLAESGLNTPKWTENTPISSAATAGVDGKVLASKVVTIASKYVCVSIQARGETYYDQVWIYDLALDRWGRLVIDHLEVFEDENYRLAVITEDRRYLYVASPFYPSVYEREPIDPYIVLGRFQYSRQRLLAMQEIELENLYPDSLYTGTVGGQVCWTVLGCLNICDPTYLLGDPCSGPFWSGTRYESYAIDMNLQVVDPLPGPYTNMYVELEFGGAQAATDVTITVGTNTFVMSVPALSVTYAEDFVLTDSPETWTGYLSLVNSVDPGGFYANKIILHNGDHTPCSVVIPPP